MDYLQSIPAALQRYFAETVWGAWTFWGVLLGALLAAYVLTLLLSKILQLLATPPAKADADASALFTSEFRLRRAGVWACCLTAMVAFGLLTATALTILPRSTEMRFPLLFVLVAMLLWAFVALRGLQKDFTAEALPGLVGRSITPRDQARRGEAARRSCDRLKWLFLLPLFGLAAWSATFLKSNDHIAIVLDNSYSMDTHINNGKIILTRLLGEMSAGTTISVTIFPQPIPPAQSLPERPLAEVMKIKATTPTDPALPAEVHDFGSPAEAVGFLQGNIPIVYGSPIAEAVWKTYLLRVAAAGGQGSVQPGTLVVVTDGDEPGANFALTQFFQSDPDFAAVFPPEQTHLIDVNGQMNNAFFAAGNNAGCQVHTGTNIQDYENSMRLIVQDDLFEWPVLVLAVLVVVVFGVLAMLSRPSRLAYA